MTPSFSPRSLGLAWMLACAASAQAAPFTLNAGQVNIEYDTDGFAFSHETTSFGGVVNEDIPTSSFGIQAVGNGVQINFNDLLSVYASSYVDFYQQTRNGSFNAFFNVTPVAGYAITGYTLTYTGDYSVETPGSVYLGDALGTFFSQTTGGGPFTVSTTVAGASAPAIQGSFSAFGDINTIQVFDGYDTYIDHYEDVLDYCETDNPSVCHYHSEPIYISQPIYHDETDLGEASINIRTVTLTAQVAAVPEPSGHWLLLAGLPLAAARLGRRQA